MNSSVGLWNNPPPPGTELFNEEDEQSSTSSKSKPSDGIRHKSKEHDRYDSDHYSRGHRRSRSRSRNHKSKDRRHRSRDRHHRSRSRNHHRYRSRSHDRYHRRSSSSRRRHKSRKESRHSHRYSRSRSSSTSRSRSQSVHNQQLSTDDIKTEINTSIEEEEEPSTKENAFKNDGSFLEMFKKMQEEQQKAAEIAAAKAQEAADATPGVSKRRGGRILKTGLVEKVKPLEEPVLGQGFDAWSVYMKEVRRYKEACCDDDSKTRPLVK